MGKSDSYWKNPPDEHTKVKTEIVTKYFASWSQIIRRWTSDITYLDLYAGAGEHDSGDLSTALQIMKEAAEDKFLQKNLKIVLNDAETEYAEKTKFVMNKYGLEERFCIKPRVENIEVDELTPDLLKTEELGAIFCFIDPFGYKGLTIRLIESVIEDWGCDCIAFFNTSRINRSFEHNQNIDDMIALLGQNHYESVLRRAIQDDLSRESIIIDEFKNACKDAGARYFIAFQINKKKSRRISHHICFLSKHRRGFSIIKDIMADKSAVINGGVPRYIYSNGAKSFGDQQSIDFGQFMSMSELKNILLIRFHGRTLAVKDIIDTCDDMGVLYTRRNIKSALDQLEKEGNIMEIKTGKRKRQRGTFADDRIIRFPC